MSEAHPSRVQFDWTINFGNIIVIFTLVVTIVLAWAQMDKRIATLESTQMLAEQRAAKFVPIIEKLDKTLDRLDGRLADFPLHKHIDSRIMYPAPSPLRPQALPGNGANGRVRRAQANRCP